jgi:hypothetical protein
VEGDKSYRKLNQTLLNTAMGRMRDILDFSGLENCSVVTTVFSQGHGVAYASHEVRFALASSKVAVSFGEVYDETVKNRLESRRGEFCSYPQYGSGREINNLFCVEGGLFWLDGEEPDLDSLTELARLVDDLFVDYYDWLIDPNRDGDLCVIDVGD